MEDKRILNPEFQNEKDDNTPVPCKRCGSSDIGFFGDGLGVWCKCLACGSTGKRGTTNMVRAGDDELWWTAADAALVSWDDANEKQE